MVITVAGFEVTPEELQAVARELGDVSTEIQRGAVSFSGIQDALTGQAPGFEIMWVAGECESSWQRAIQAQAAKLALDGDSVGLAAAGYRSSEQALSRSLGGR